MVQENLWNLFLSHHLLFPQSIKYVNEHKRYHTKK
jgi:hypothetical protein